MENPDPICACCRQKIHTAWVAWEPNGTVTCGNPLCAGWAESRQLHVHTRGLVALRKGPVRRPGKPRCDYCGRERPPKKDCFVVDALIFCTLTCQRRSLAIGR